MCVERSSINHLSYKEPVRQAYICENLVKYVFYNNEKHSFLSLFFLTLFISFTLTVLFQM